MSRTKSVPRSPAPGSRPLTLVWNPPGIVGDIVDERIVMGHGAGGRKMYRLIRNVFLKHFGSPALNRLEDSAVLGRVPGELCLTTDSYVVRPLFFPGGDIGRLAVCGAVNDLAVVGAEPRFLSLGFIIREGLEMTVLERVCASVAAACREAGVSIVTGDTKVIERGEDEGLYVNVSGVGVRRPGTRPGAERVRAGDELVVTGLMGEHEAAVALARGSYRFRGRVRSDCAPIAGMLLPLIRSGVVKLARDPTRGGLATTVNEFAEASGLGFVIDEAAVPVSKEVRAVAGLLGVDPLYMANEGKAVLVVAARDAERVVQALRRHRRGRHACRIGRAVKSPEGVRLETRIGSRRPLFMLEGEQLPRIC